MSNNKRKKVNPPGLAPGRESESPTILAKPEESQKSILSNAIYQDFEDFSRKYSDF